MNVDVTDFKKNTALIAIILIDLMFLVWSCENESGKIAKRLSEKNKKDLVQTINLQHKLI